MKKLRTIQIGMTHEHADGKIAALKLLSDDFEVVGIVDDTALDTPKRYWGSPLFAEYPHLTFDQAFAMEDIDCAIVEVPNLELVPIAFRCLEKNWPIHLDKPAGETLEPYQKLLEGYKAKNLPLQMGYMYRGNPAFKFCQQLVRNGVLGDIFEIDMDMHHGYGGDEYQEYIGKFKGGIMFNLGCHLIDFVCSIMGEPQRVEHFLLSTPDAPGSGNNAMAVLQYPNATVSLRACSRFPVDNVNRRSLKIVGSKGWLEFSPVERFDGNPIELTLALKDGNAFYPAGINTIKFPPQTDRYIEQLSELAEIIRGNAVSPYSYEHDLMVHKVTLAASGYINLNP